MNPDSLLSLADSKNVALIISLIVNIMLGWALNRIYQAKEKLNGQITEFLKVLIPFAVGRRIQNDETKDAGLPA